MYLLTVFLVVSECVKVLCFRYYSGLSLSCLAKTEPMDLDAVYKLSVRRTRARPSDLLRLRDKGNCSSESESESETSTKSRKRGWRLLKKKSSLPNGFLYPLDKADESDTDSSRHSLKDLQTWNSHEHAQTVPDLPDQDQEYLPIWNQKSPVTTKSVYETLYPSSEPPPPLPPRSYPPRHRPLERTRALHSPLHLHSPPEVLRKNKPFTWGPILPPKPKKALNPEDTFGFEIVDTDEFSGASSLQESFSVNGDTTMKPWGAGSLVVDVVTVPLATPELDNSSIDTSSFDNIIDEEDVVKNKLIEESSVGSSHLSSQTNFSLGDSVPSLNKTECTSEMPSKDPELSQNMLSVPNNVNASTSQVSPNSASTPTSDSGIVLTNSLPGSNPIVLSTRSSSSDSIGTEITDGPEIINNRPRSATENETTVRSHKPLSRQISHPPDSSVMSCLTELPRPQNRLLNRITSPTSFQCPPTPTHHARPVRASFQSPILPRHSTLTRDFNNASLILRPLEPSIETSFPLEPFREDSDATCHAMEDSACSSGATPNGCSILSIRHNTSTRLPSIPERTAKSQRLEIGSDEEPLPPRKSL